MGKEGQKNILKNCLIEKLQIQGLINAIKFSFTLVSNFKSSCVKINFDIVNIIIIFLSASPS